MRATTGQEAQVIAGPDQALHVQVLVQDSGGTWRDLCALEGVDWVEEIAYGEQVDQPVATAEISVRRQEYARSLSPGDEASQFNLLTGSYSALLFPGRSVEIRTVLAPIGYPRPAADAAEWNSVFEGRIDEVDWASDPIRVACRDKGARLQDAFIERERAYGLTGQTFGLLVWTDGLDVRARSLPSQPYGTLIRPSDPDDMRVYVCSASGTTGSTDVHGNVVEPEWTSNPAVPISDGTAAWTYVGTVSESGTDVEVAAQQMIDDVIGQGGTELAPTSLVPLWVPTSPAWTIGKWVQRREPLLDALRNLVSQIGWDVRYRWDSSTSAWRLKLYEPDRTASSPLRWFDGGEYIDVRRVAVRDADVRNVIEVLYSDRTDRLPDQSKKRKRYTASDSSSIAKYGRRYMEICLAATDQIDTPTEAEKCALACLADLKEPTAEVEIETRYFWPAELQDLYGFEANNEHFSENKLLAVVGIQHRLPREGMPTTTLTLRGQPAGAFKLWHSKGSRPGVADAAADFTPHGTGSVTATATPGGFTLSFAQDTLRRGDVEVHTSTTSGFAPSSSTLRALTRSSRLDLTGFTPGTQQYGRLVMRDTRGNRSALGPEWTVTPRLIGADDVDPSIIGPGGATNTARADLGTGYSFPSRPVDWVGDFAQQIVWDTESWDVGSMLDVSADTFTIPANGRYRLQAQVAVTGVAAGTVGYLYLLKGSTITALGTLAVAQIESEASGTMALTAALDVTLPFSASDVLKVYLAGSSGLWTMAVAAGRTWALLTQAA